MVLVAHSLPVPVSASGENLHLWEPLLFASNPLRWASPRLRDGEVNLQVVSYRALLRPEN
jgi:hypothetical protein